MSHLSGVDPGFSKGGGGGGGMECVAAYRMAMARGRVPWKMRV